MTNIELVNAINNAIAEGRVVKSGERRIFGAYLRRGFFGGEYVVAVYNEDEASDKATVLRQWQTQKPKLKIMVVLALFLRRISNQRG